MLLRTMLVTLLLASACGPRGPSTTPAATRTAQNVGIGPDTSGGTNQATGFCQCEAWCDSNWVCGNHHLIQCNVAGVTDSASCGARCGGLHDPEGRCGGGCAHPGVRDITPTFVTSLDPAFQRPCAF